VFAVDCEDEEVLIGISAFFSLGLVLLIGFIFLLLTGRVDVVASTTFFLIFFSA
jgi:hypothetical protein